MSEDNNNNDWKSWSQHVLIELRRLDQDIKETKDVLQKINIKLAMLEAKTVVWGSLGGILITGIFTFFVK